MASKIEGPDFICIGMPKAGTDWLFDQLQYHPDFWMPPVKEIAYLVHKTGKLKHVNTHLRRLKKPEPRRRNLKRPGDERDRLFVEEAATLTGEPRSVKRYAELFRFKSGLLSGDISPTYCRLNRDAVREIATCLPDTKIVLLVRDPVARMWSHLSMLNRSGNFSRHLLEDTKKLREYLKTEKSVEQRSLASHTARRWANWAPELQFRHFFFDDIEARPEEARKQILEFLGADPTKASGDLAVNYNRKSDQQKLVLTDAVKAVLAKHLRKELYACAEQFGGPATAWSDRYGI